MSRTLTGNGPEEEEEVGKVVRGKTLPAMVRSLGFSAMSDGGLMEGFSGRLTYDLLFQKKYHLTGILEDGLWQTEVEAGRPIMRLLHQV